MGYGRTISLAGLMLGLVELAPVERAALEQTVAQAVDSRKVEGDRLQSRCFSSRRG